MKCCSRDDFDEVIERYVDFYNNDRPNYAVTIIHRLISVSVFYKGEMNRTEYC